MKSRSNNQNASPRDQSRGDASFLLNAAMSLYMRHIQNGLPVLMAQKKVAYDLASSLWRFIKGSEHPIKEFIPLLAAPLGSALDSLDDPEAREISLLLKNYVQKFKLEDDFGGKGTNKD